MRPEKYITLQFSFFFFLIFLELRVGIFHVIKAVKMTSSCATDACPGHRLFSLIMHLYTEFKMTIFILFSNMDNVWFDQQQQVYTFLLCFKIFDHSRFK